MTPDQNPPVDTAALAETKVLPRPMVNVERQIRKDTPEWSAYRKARFAPGTGYTFEMDGHRWAYQYSSFDDAGEFDLIFRKAPAPIDPVPHTAPKCDSCGGAGFHSDVGHAPGEECSHCEGSGIVPHTEGRKDGMHSCYKTGELQAGTPAECVHKCAPQAPVGSIQKPADLPRFTCPTWEEFAAVRVAVNSHATLTDALTKARAELAAWKAPGSKVGQAELIGGLLLILDAPALVQALKGGEV